MSAALPFIVFSGNIATGKSTLGRIVSERLSFEFVAEPVPDLLFLDEFFADMPRWAFLHQLDFNVLKAAQEQRIMSRTRGVCADRSLDECVHVFGRHCYEAGWISAKEWQLMCRAYAVASAGLCKPDLIVHLTADIPILVKRIKERRRPHEVRLDVGWLRAIAALYATWISQVEVPALTIDTGIWDFVACPQHVEDVVQLISNRIRLIAQRERVDDR